MTLLARGGPLKQSILFVPFPQPSTERTKKKIHKAGVIKRPVCAHWQQFSQEHKPVVTKHWIHAAFWARLVNKYLQITKLLPVGKSQLTNTSQCLRETQAAPHDHIRSGILSELWREHSATTEGTELDKRQKWPDAKHSLSADEGAKHEEGMASASALSTVYFIYFFHFYFFVVLLLCFFFLCQKNGPTCCFSVFALQKTNKKKSDTIFEELSDFW